MIEEDEKEKDKNELFDKAQERNNENEILKTFESMLRKKMQKNLEQASIQSRGLTSKSIIGLYGN